jgi:GNAT superfamily N-acetyltransferase
VSCTPRLLLEQLDAHHAEATAKLVHGMPAHPIGMVLLARLAVNQSQQGRGVGAMLLAEALRKMKDVRASLDSSVER